MLPARTRPRIIPVLDVMNGQVVRAVSGRRDEYRPISSKITASTEPLDVAKALLEASGASELYVADLDAISGGAALAPAVQALTALHGCRMWVDAGISLEKSVEVFGSDWFTHPVIGLETAADPRVLAWSVAISLVPVAFSIDLKAGRLLGNWRAWELEGERDVLSLARGVVGMGVRTLIVLDLVRVGTGTGTGTEPLLRAIRDEFPDVDLIAGGGVRNWDDVDHLGEAGATGVLVASALHDGSLKVT